MAADGRRQGGHDLVDGEGLEEADLRGRRPARPRRSGCRRSPRPRRSPSPSRRRRDPRPARRGSPPGRSGGRSARRARPSPPRRCPGQREVVRVRRLARLEEGVRVLGRAAHDRAHRASCPGRGRPGRPRRGRAPAGRRPSSSAILLISCDVRKPSKKWRNGTRARRVAAWATRAKSWASWTEPAASIAQPVARACMTSLWSPKIDRAWVAIVRAATWMTAGVSSPAILNMLGIIRRRPCDAVNVVARAPFWSAPCIAPAAPALGLHLDDVRDRAPEVRAARPPPSRRRAPPSARPGVIGKIEITSLSA